MNTSDKIKVCIAKIVSVYNYHSYDDYDEVTKVIPETEWEEVTSEEYKGLVSTLKTSRNNEYVLLSLLPPEEKKETLRSLKEEWDKEIAKRTKLEKQQEIANKKLEQKRKEKQLEAKRKKLEKLKAELGEK